MKVLVMADVDVNVGDAEVVYNTKVPIGTV